MPYQPVDYGNALLKAEQINALRAQNDPNSLKNQLLTEKLNALRNNPGAGSNRVSPVSFKDATAETLAEYQRTGNPGVLKRHYNPYKPWTVDTKTSREFWDINVNTREPELITSIPIENFTAAYDSAAGAAAVAEGLPNPNAAPSQPQQVPNAGLPPVAPQPAPYVPKSSAQLAADKKAAEIAATDEANRALPDEVEKREDQMYEAQHGVALIDGLLKEGRIGKAYGRENELLGDMVKPQSWVDAEAERDQVVAMLQLAAAGKLKGQGQITENERVMLARAATVLGNPLISPNLARREMKKVKEYFARVEARKSKSGTDDNVINWEDL